MALSSGAQAIYQHLVTKTVPAKKVTTYGDVSTATKVPIGVEGGVIGAALGEVAQACEKHNLPPLSSIVVRADEHYDNTRRHGMPGVGYFVMRSVSDPLFAKWQQKPPPPSFDKDASRWEMRTTIEAHQNAVWQCSSWPTSL